MISPSFFDKAERCERRAAFGRWGEQYGYTREPQGDGAKFGDELHKDNAEPYLLSGKMPDRLTKAGELFIQGLPFLPPPGAGGVEGEFDLTVSGVGYTGKIDYRGPLPDRALFLGRYEAVADVTLDHKTSSNPKEYGLWEREDWLNDAQAIIYGARTLVHTKADHVNFRWLYYYTKGRPKAEPSDVVLTKGEIEGRFGEWIHPRGVRLTQLLQQRPHPNELPCNTAACNDFHKRCHYYDNCKRTTAEMLEGSLIAVDNLRKKKGNKEMTPNPGLGNLSAALAALTGGAPAQAPVAAPVAQPTFPAFNLPAAAPAVVAAPPAAAMPAMPAGLNLGAFAAPVAQAPVAAPQPAPVAGISLAAFGMPGAPAIGVNAPESMVPVAVEKAPPAVTATVVPAAVMNAQQSQHTAAFNQQNAIKVICEELAQAFTRAAARL